MAIPGTSEPIILSEGLVVGFRVCTPPKFNIAAENGWLEDYFPFGKVTFRELLYVKLRGHFKRSRSVVLLSEIIEIISKIDIQHNEKTINVAFLYKEDCKRKLQHATFKQNEPQDTMNSCSPARSLPYRP